MKALKLLQELEEYYSLILARELATRKLVKKQIDKDLENINDRINDIQEAIAELEALQQPKNCDGCKYEHKDAYSLPCAACVRNCDSDYYEPKEQ